LGEIRPIQRGRNGFHMNDTLDAMTILSGPVKPEYGAPVVQHEPLIANVNFMIFVYLDSRWSAIIRRSVSDQVQPLCFCEQVLPNRRICKIDQG
jgi:hypothetical protein